MYAIIETGGKQYKVQNGDVLFVEKLDAAEESSVTFDKVVALHNDKELKVGAPYVKGASVEARVVKNGKGKKIAVFTYKPKKGCKRALGHRQPYTKVQVEVINAKAPKAPKAERPTPSPESAAARPIPRRGTGFSGCRWRNRPAVRIFSWG